MVWRHHWTLWARQKHRFWGSKIVASSKKFAHWLNAASSTTYILVFWKFWKFPFCGHFYKKVIFWHFLKKNKISKIRDSYFVDLAFYVLYIFCLHLPWKPYFWWIFKHLPFIGPKSGEVTSQNSTYIKTIPADFDFKDETDGAHQKGFKGYSNGKYNSRIRLFGSNSSCSTQNLTRAMHP